MIAHDPLVAQAALLSPPFAILTYALPSGFGVEFWQPGLRLAVPLGKTLRPALLLETDVFSAWAGGQKSTAKRNNPATGSFILKEVVWPLENAPLLTQNYLEFARQLALRQSQPLGRTLAAMLPVGLRTLKLRLHFFPEGTPPLDLDLPALARSSTEERLRLAELWRSGHGRVYKLRESADEEFYRLKLSPPWPVRPSAARQIKILEFMAEWSRASRKQILKHLGAEMAPSLKILLERGLLELRREETAKTGVGVDATAWRRRYGPLLRTPPPFALNQEQREAMNLCLEAIIGHRAETHLLYGVTGSGKTAVYLELAARTLLEGRSVLLLAPELALANKLKHDAEKRFPCLPTRLFHSDQSPAGREACFKDLARTNVPYLVIGARSALFLQIDNLGLIILDEEHDASFKQDERFNYSAKELAWFLAGRLQIPLLLGSATPDLKSFYAAEQGHIHLHRLTKRVGGGSLPEARLEPLSRRAVNPGGILTPESARELAACVKQGGQAVILLNRRGFAPNMYCLSCGQSARCPNCEISLTYHKRQDKLLCHYCGHSADFPQPCAGCGNMTYLPMGEGTEKLEESLNSSLPVGTRVLRLDRDSAARSGAPEEILSAFGRGEADVLVGTQMLSKGHHFPRVSLVIVADGDLGLNMLDYNAAERVFQLIMQAAGRSGRGDTPGRVIIQTRDPGHYCWAYVLTNDYEGFYRQELERRRRRLYPPFTRLAMLRLSYPRTWIAGAVLLSKLAEKLQAAAASLGVTMLGPAPAPHPLRENRLRFQCLLKSQSWQDMRTVYAAAAGSIPPSSPFHLTLDLDPAGG
ncbi:MAG: primosomal protein N' [Deltaproteobacteria bacterium]|jgi:primosomal protein N' (replication factor Y)|nr:primosomal protein N' [Deltaproteobacteria bacterium]